MKKYCLLLLLLYSCTINIQKEISLSEIDIKTIFEDLECGEALEWWPTMEEATQSFINILKNDYNQKYTKIVLVEFCHSGETVVHNSLTIFHDLEGNMTVLSFGMDWHTVRKKIKMPFITTEKILSKLATTNGNFTKMWILDITKDTAKCDFIRNFSYENYKGLQDLSFFN
ncbi:hypothetical protein H2O64_12050 [Kordia sp. YSTF-M3]|uniref:Lipoprotein n=1 Tax=Kordia aestuariivivens TaxID=2759037 RepID=A0ABR7QAB1_9FLAO|nr:hypothetical protein [Kordia aestuariivivens]MBC8755413.1 hypothetical protein [Kordia aestuariivivens]